MSEKSLIVLINTSKMKLVGTYKSVRQAEVVAKKRYLHDDFVIIDPQDYEFKPFTLKELKKLDSNLRCTGRVPTTREDYIDRIRSKLIAGAKK